MDINGHCAKNQKDNKLKKNRMSTGFSSIHAVLFMVGVTGFEPAASCSGNKYIKIIHKMYKFHLFC
jgi:hypothetical protein